jgi:uncharacterized membrane protein YkvA (DUF1232 family)
MTSIKGKTIDFFETAKILYLEKAKGILAQEGQLKKLMERVAKRIQDLKNHPKINSAIEPLMIFKRMIKAHKNGEHKIPLKTQGLLVLGLLYFVMPFDLIPDFIPLLGYADDLSVILAIFKAVQDEVKEFLEWEKSRL